jgi:hypothetical protein
MASKTLSHFRFLAEMFGIAEKVKDMVKAASIHRARKATRPKYGELCRVVYRRSHVRRGLRFRVTS